MMVRLPIQICITQSDWVILVSGCGLNSTRNEDIIQTDADLFSIGLLGINYREILSNIYWTYSQEYAFQECVYKVSAELGRLHMGLLPDT